MALAPPTASGLKPLFILTERHHGRGRVAVAWNRQATLLATSGASGIVNVFDRHGALAAELQLESRAPCLALEWDKDGEALAVLQQGVERVAVWDAVSRGTLYIDTALREPTFLRWSRLGPQLAIGSVKGGLVMFRKDSRKKLPIAGKHSKAIVCGDWSGGRDNRLALGGLDNMLTISTADGDTVEQTALKTGPVAMQFAVRAPRASPAAPAAGAAIDRRISSCGSPAATAETTSSAPAATRCTAPSCTETTDAPSSARSTVTPERDDMAKRWRGVKEGGATERDLRSF